MAEEYRLPDVFVQLPVADDDEFDRWEHVRGDYRICIARYYDGETSFWWVGKVGEEVPSIYAVGKWTEEASLEKASKAAWSAYRILDGMDQAFGPAKD
jgi:hypothetical protein